MSPVPPALEKEVLQAVKLLQKRKGVTTRRVIQYLVTFCGYERQKDFCTSVRRVLRRTVRRGEALRDGMRYKLLFKDNHMGICQCKSKHKSKKTKVSTNKNSEKHEPDFQNNPTSEGSSKSSE